MSIKSLWCTLVCATLILMNIGCSSDEPEDFQPGALSGAQLTLKITDLKKSSADLWADSPGKMGFQHTTDAHIYLFEGQGEEASYSGYSFDAEWSNYFLSQGKDLPVHTDSVLCKIPFCLKEGEDYTIVGISYSQDAVKVFGNPMNLSPGSKLSSLKFTMQSNANLQQLSQSELYTGLVAFTYTKDMKLRLELSRRVSRVEGHFVGIPPIFPSATGIIIPIDYIRIRLFKPQNTQSWVLKHQQKPIFQDYIDSNSDKKDSEVIVKIDCNYGKVEGMSNVKIVSGGSYLLPVAAPVNKDATLYVDIMGEGDEVLDSIRVKLPNKDGLDHGSTGGGTGIIDDKSALRFPIVANHFYSIGSESNPINIEELINHRQTLFVGEKSF